MELEDCYKGYIAEFGDDSWFSFNFNDEEKVRVTFNRISDFTDNCFIHLTRSILSGEYIKCSNFENILKDFLDRVIGFESFEVLDQPSSIVSTEYKLKKEFNELNNSLHNALRYYQLFIEESRRKFKFYLTDEKYGIFQIRNKIGDNSLVLFNELSMPLCRYDYYLPVQSNDFQDLLLIRKELTDKIGSGTSSELKKIFSILLCKCNYIIRRVKNKPFESHINFIPETINPLSLDLGDYSFFIGDLIDDKDKYLKSINSESQDILPFVFLMKYYKDNLSNADDIRQMEHVIDRYLEKYDRFKRSQFHDNEMFKKEYDAFSWNSVLNFLHNCYFSYYVQKCNPNLKSIKQKIYQIQDIQGETSIKNFHPYKKAIEVIIRCIKEHLKNNKFDDTLITDKLDELNRLIEKLESSLKWSELHKFFPFQLPFNESSYYSKENGLNLFVPSAFAQYIDYRKLKNELSSFKKESDNLSFLFGLSKERRDIENLKETIQTTDKKAFDLIAVFTAAITFLFGTVNIFVANEKADLSLLICNTTGLGILLILFTALYLLISPILIQHMYWVNYFKKARFWFGLIGVCIYVLLAFYLYDETKSIEMIRKEKEEMQNIELRIDSLQHEYDSLFNNLEHEIVVKKINENHGNENIQFSKAK